ncbi:MAG: hypothetical protein ACFFG0_09960, partial [Candidatus Thorarchaeota archaeon]
GQFIERLAYSIAYIPAETIALIKKCVVAAEELPRRESLLEESYLFAIAAALPESKKRMNQALNSGLQQREAELGPKKRLEELEKFLGE